MEELMATWLKVVLIIGAVIVLIIAGVAGLGVYVWKKHGPELVASSKQGLEEGRVFGEQTDNQGCVDEGVVRQRKAVGIGEMIKSGIFMRSCLEASRPTPNFCDGVPGALQFVKTAEWRKAQCDKYGMTEAQQCSQLFQQVQQFCEQQRARKPSREQ
jgi:hypothetical protein